MTQSPHISVVLPCRNQADHIDWVLKGYLLPLERLEVPFELVVVPNASTDGTEEVVRALAQQDPRIRVVSNPRGGWGLSVRAGLDAARGEILVYTNTARTDPTSLPDFIRQYKMTQPSLVKARREKRNAPMREMGSMLYNLEARLLFGIKVQDINGTPKVFSKDFYSRFQLYEEGDLLDLELMARATQQQIPIIEIPVQGFKRHGGRSSTTFKSAWKMYSGAFRLWSRKKRVAG